MKRFLIPEQGNFYKANLHCHTNISDGAMSPEEIKRIYKEQGYHAVCYTDHEVLIGHKDLCDDGFIALHGYEVAIKQDESRHTSYHMPVYHFNMIAEDQNNLIMPRCYKNNPSMPGKSREFLKTYKPYDENDTIDHTEYSIDWLNQYLPAVKEKGFLITYNHPQWSIQSEKDYIGLRGLHAVEAINGGCIYQGDCTTYHFEQMQRNGMDVVVAAGDDTHTVNEAFRCWTMIKAEKLTYDALIKAYKNGDCYVSTGPEIKALYMEDGKLHIETTPDVLVILRGEGRYSGVRKSDGEAVFDYYPDSLGAYFRFEVKDNSGRVAFTGAYKTADIEK